MKKIILLFSMLLSTSLLGQNAPVQLHGQFSYDLTNSYSLPIAKIECKKMASIISIKSHLMIMNPEIQEISEEILNCIYDNLLTIEIVEENIENNVLHMKIIASTYTNLLEGCLH